VERVARATDGLEGARVALLGLTFKPDTDDLREAPALEIASMLIARGATVVAYDPMPTARARAAEIVPGLTVVDRAMKAIVGADAIGLVTEWPEFSRLPWGAIAKAVRRRVVIDGRNALAPDAIVAAGFEYVGFGRHGRTDATSEAAAPAVPEDSAVPAPTRERRRSTDGGHAGRRPRSKLGIESNATGA
jgi:UDPglucose 6-dehydrogenase